MGTRGAGPTEDEFTAQVMDLARLYRWRVAHFRPAQTVKGWRTAVQGDGEGFPDLELVRSPRVVKAELKVGKNPATTAQLAWLAAYEGVPGVEAYLWTPTDWPEIERVLARAGET